MVERAWFIPGRPGEPGGPLVRYRPVQPVGAVGAYVADFTSPGDLVVDLFCQGPTAVREAVEAGRRALGLSFNPLLLVAARLGLDWPDVAALNAAFTRLADSPKGDVPLSRHVTSLYRSACPTCGAPGVAEWLAWDREGDYPFRKAVRCSHCDGVQEGSPDDADVEIARRTTPRGLHYYYALDRAAPPGHPARERTAELVELYTPRNLSALMDVAMRLEELEAGREVKRVLVAALLDCFDACSSLDPAGEERPRPRTLRVPAHYLERNVWLCLETGFSHLLAEAPSAPVPCAPDAAALVRGEAEGYVLSSHAARDVRKILQPGSAALVVADPPRPDAVFWALSALWSNWLWESPLTRRLRPFLRRRRFDWEWHWRVLRAALQAAGPLLAPHAHLVTFFSEPDETFLGSVCLATASAGYDLEGWGYCAEAGYRLVWRWSGAAREVVKPAADQVEALTHEVMAVAEEAVASTLRARGEPAPWPLLHASTCAALAQEGTLARAASVPKGGPSMLSLIADVIRRACETPSLIRLADREGAPLWLEGGVPPVEALADRVEAEVWDLLVGQPAWDMESLVDAVYALFHGPLTPDLALVLVCIDSYSLHTPHSEQDLREGEGLHLRPEDDPLRRAAEVKALCGDLVTLGERLGFGVDQHGHWDVRWLEDGQEAYVFSVASMATLAHHMLTERPADTEAQRCLVLPGGRAQLATFKLQRDQRLALAVEADRWQFIKFRLLRRLVAEEDLDRHALKTILGLDPIAEQEAAQIPLF